MGQDRSTIPTTAPRDAHSPAFGDLLRRFRVAVGLTQEELAERANVSARSLTNYESGATLRPQRETVRLLADALGLSSEDRALLVAALRAQRAQPVTPAPAATVAPSIHLPAPLVPLLGREHELASLTALVLRDDVRLATVIGPGGVGKTRLALALAATVRGAFADGAYFVSLAPVREPEVLLLAVAQTLGVQPTGTQTPFDALCAWLSERHVLLVLDNFEHLLSEAVVVANLLMRCAGVTVLATSRTPLHLRGEHEYLLAPLAMPVESPKEDVEAVEGSPAVQVFTYYARAVQTAFQVTAENAAAVAAICAHLEGLPLSLELAAARIKWFTPEQLLARLTPRLSALVDGARDLPTRQQTMWNTIAWSDGLLAAAEQRVFARFAVFAGGATTDAVEAVCGAGSGAHAESLVQQNLLTLTPREDDVLRYGMLETVREYAWRRARDLDEAPAAQRRHAEYYLAFAEAARPHLDGRARGTWLQRLTIELDNIRAALRWAQDAGESATSLRFIRALLPYWQDRGYLREGWEWAQAALQASEDAGPGVLALRAASLVSAGDLRYRLDDYAHALALANEGLTLARAREDERTIARALSLIGMIAIDRGEPAQARIYHEESLTLFRRLDDQLAVARILNCLASGAFFQGDYPRALRFAEESYALSDELGDELNAALELLMLARICNAMGERERAHGYAERSITIYRRIGNTFWLSMALLVQGDILRALHRDAEALALYDEGIAIAREIGIRRREFWGVMGRAESLYALGRYAEAAVSFARGFVVARQLASKQPFAPGLEGVAILAHTLGQHAHAATLLSAATSLLKTIGMPQRPEDQAVMDTARRVLGDEEFAAAWAAGEAMPLDDAIAQAVAFLDTVSHDRATTIPQRSAAP